MPTLERLPKHIPIIAQSEAADRIRPLGFKNLTVISHGQTMQLCDGRLQLTATAGALVGPPWSTRQNGYVIKVREQVSRLCSWRVVRAVAVELRLD
jgi:hypothetical protein